MSAAEDFADVVRAALGQPDPAAHVDPDSTPRAPAPNRAQGTSDGGTPQQNPGDMFVDFLSRQLRSFDPNTHPGRVDPAAAGQRVGWHSA